MGLGELVANTVLKFQADTSDLKAKLKDLQGTEKELAKTQLESAQQRNEGLSKWAEGLANATLAMEGVAKVVEFAKDATKEYADNLRLSAAAGKTDIDGLKDAFNGLVTEHEALTFAAQAQHGVLKLTQQQMESVGRATVALSRAGFDQKEVFAKLQEAVVSLKTRGLDDYGIAVKQGSNETETLNNIITALNQKVDENAGLMETEAEKITKTANAWADFKEELGKWTAQATEALPVLDQLIIRRKLLGGGTASTEDLYGKGFNYDQIIGGVTPEEAKDPWAGDANVTAAGVTRGIVALAALGKKFGEYGEAQKAAIAAAKQLAEQRRALANATSKSVTDDLVKQLEDEQSQAFLDKGVTGGLGSISQEGNMPELDRAMAAQATMLKQNKDQTMLESLFGKPDQMAVYKDLLNGTFGAVADGIDALIVGSEKGSKSFAQSIGGILHAVAVKELTMGIAEEAEAVASLILGNPVAAGQHAAAGAEYLAVGAAIDLAAKGLGYSGSSQKPSSGGGGGSGGSGSGGSSGVTPGNQQPQQHQNTIVIGDPFFDSTQRERMLRAQRALQLAQGTTGVIQDS